MAVTFPTSPTNGQTFTANGLSYVYNATYGVWRLNVSAGGSGGSGGSGGGVTVYATVAELPLTNNSNGDMAFVEETDRLYLSNDNGWFNIALINTNPTITSGGAGSYNLATDGTPTVITLTATDPEELPLTWSYTVTSGALGTTATVTQADNVFTITPGTDAENDGGTFQLTFSVTDGANIVNDVNSFSLNFITIVDDSSYTLLLLQTDAASADNQIDISSNSHTITENGSVTSTAFSPYHPKGYSVYFDKVGDGLNSSITATDSGDFTYECWVYPTDLSNYGSIFSSGGSGIGVIVSSDQWWIGNAASVYQFVSGNQFTLNTWQHVAVVRENSVVTGYVDGVSVGSASGVGSITSTLITLGSRYNNNTTYLMQGYIRDFRFVTEALYSSDFTPPTEPLEVVTNTDLMLCHLPYIADGSTNNRAISVLGNPTVELFTPYDHLSYTKADHGGSAYFPNASGTYMDLDINAIGTSDYTIEGWIYPQNNASELVFDTRPTATDNTTGFYGLVNSSNKFVVGSNNVTYITSTPTLALRTWYHFAIVRNGSAMTLYINGTNAGTGTQSQDLTSTDMRIGTNRSAASVYRGYIADLRLVIGTQVYTSDFTPPTEPLTAISGTELLTCTNTHSVWDAATGSTFTLGGDAAASTAQYKYSTDSIAFDGTGDYLEIPYSDDIMRWWDTDYTMEYWIRANAFGQSPPSDNKTNFMTHGERHGTTDYWSMGPVANGTVEWFWWSGTVNRFSTTTALSVDTWYHLAFVYDKATTTAKIYIDGTLEASTTVTTTPQVSSGYPLNIGHGPNNAAFNGYIEDFRISKGLARYSTNFTPPSAALDG